MDSFTKNSLGLLRGLTYSFLLGNAVWYDSEVHANIKKMDEMIPMNYMTITTRSEVYDLFLRSRDEIDHLSVNTKSHTYSGIAALIAIPLQARSYENTVRALDVLWSTFLVNLNRLRIIEMVQPEAALREHAQAASLELEQYAIDLFFHNVELFNVLCVYEKKVYPHEALSAQERYFFDDRLMKEFVRNGLNRSAEVRRQIIDLKKEISAKESDFSAAIARDHGHRFILVSRDSLAGLQNDFIESLESMPGGLYRMGIDYPTYFEVMKQCTVENTRKELYRTFNNLAYPGNVKTLEELIFLRDTLAHVLGFESFAALSIDGTMAQTPQQALSFLEVLTEKIKKKAEVEFKRLCEDLPHGIKLTAEKKLEPWNFSYAESEYKKKHFNLDQNVLAEYFPLEKTIHALCEIYQTFFGLRFEIIKPTTLWDSTLRLLEVHRATDDELLGFIVLDLHPRPGKFSHACLQGCVPGIRFYDKNKKAIVSLPSVSIVIANFPHPTPQKEALLKHDDVITFFHEFGHAMHEVLGQCEIATLSGTETKIDFVEMPSQMFEQWMWDEAILSQVSSHYKTGKKLPADIMATMLKLKHFNAGYATLRQCSLALFSLACFEKGPHKDTTTLMHSLFGLHIPFLVSDEASHFQAAFGHLTGYNARYYSYLWSKVFALDMFEHIKEQGLLNEKVGIKLTRDVLSKGGACEPGDMIRSFLGRAYTQEAFLKDMEI